MIELTEEQKQELERLCRKHGAIRLELFGSGARDDFDPIKSDLDFLVTEATGLPIEEAADRYFGLKADLEKLFGREVDLIHFDSVRNPYLREKIANSRVPLYAA